MNKQDVVINGFSRSVIINLVKNLREKATECYISSSKILLSPEKDSLKTFVEKYGSLIHMLSKWMMVDKPKKFNNSKELGDFLEKAESLLYALTPPE